MKDKREIVPKVLAALMLIVGTAVLIRGGYVPAGVCYLAAANIMNSLKGRNKKEHR